MNRKVFEETVAGSTATTQENILEGIQKALDMIRPGIGTRSKLLFTHPNNKEKVGAIVKTVTEAPKDLFIPFPWRVVTSHYLPEEVLKKTGKITWHDTRFVKYSDGPAPGSGLSDEDYLSMCKYFGWAEEEEVKVMGWWEMDEPQFTKFMDEAKIRQVSDKMREDVNKKIALRIFADQGNMFPQSRGLYATFA